MRAQNSSLRPHGAEDADVAQTSFAPKKENPAGGTDGVFALSDGRGSGGLVAVQAHLSPATLTRFNLRSIGTPQPRLMAKARAAGRAAVQERARNRAMDLAPTIQELQAAGCESLRAIAAGLEERGIPAARSGKWSAVQVARLLEAAAVPFDASATIAVA